MSADGSDCVVDASVASTILTAVYSEDEFEHYMDELFTAIAPGDRFTMDFGDKVPTDALYPRIQRVAAIWQERGKMPI